MSKGRPSKYDPKYCEEIIKYFDIEPNYEKELNHTTAKGSTWTDYKKWANTLPTFLGFAKKINVNGDTLVEWASARYPEDYEDETLRGELKHPDFSAAYMRAKELQKWFLIENGLNGLYNPQFAIFVAKNITDMKDKTETDLTSDGEKLEGLVVIKDGSKT